MESYAVRFAAAVRQLGEAARSAALEVPGFRSPPRLAGVDRSLRRAPSGYVTVAVVVRGRPWGAVLADMIDGIVAANRLHGPAADRARARLWAAVTGTERAAARRLSCGGRPRTPTGRGSPLKTGSVWVRSPPGARALSRKPLGTCLCGAGRKVRQILSRGE